MISASKLILYHQVATGYYLSTISWNHELWNSVTSNQILSTENVIGFLVTCSY